MVADNRSRTSIAQRHGFGVPNHVAPEHRPPVATTQAWSAGPTPTPFHTTRSYMGGWSPTKAMVAARVAVADLIARIVNQIGWTFRRRDGPLLQPERQSPIASQPRQIGILNVNISINEILDFKTFDYEQKYWVSCCLFAAYYGADEIHYFFEEPTSSWNMLYRKDGNFHELIQPSENFTSSIEKYILKIFDKNRISALFSEGNIGNSNIITKNDFIITIAYFKQNPAKHYIIQLFYNEDFPEKSHEILVEIQRKKIIN
jgi:hypothetical protein